MRSGPAPGKAPRQIDWLQFHKSDAPTARMYSKALLQPPLLGRHVLMNRPRPTLLPRRVASLLLVW